MYESFERETGTIVQRLLYSLGQQGFRRLTPSELRQARRSHYSLVRNPPLSKAFHDKHYWWEIQKAHKVKGQPLAGYARYHFYLTANPLGEHVLSPEELQAVQQKLLVALVSPESSWVHELGKNSDKGRVRRVGIEIRHDGKGHFRFTFHAQDFGRLLISKAVKEWHGR